MEDAVKGEESLWLDVTLNNITKKKGLERKRNTKVLKV
jgi:hypothetical protein